MRTETTTVRSDRIITSEPIVSSRRSSRERSVVDGDRFERTDRTVELPRAERSEGGRSLRARIGRTHGVGAALPHGRRSWEANDDLYGDRPRRSHGPVAAATLFPTPPKVTDDVVTLVTRILAVAENGDPNGDPSGVYVYADGRGGRRQVTLGIGFTEDGGSLRTVIEKYVERGGRFAGELRPFIPRIGGNPNLASNAEFKALLKRAGREDAVFADVQREVFQNNYLMPAARFCLREGLEEPLSFLVVADSYLHSGGILTFLRNRFPARTPINGGDEKAWIKQYVDTRHEWLRTHSRRILRNTIYRTRAMKEQIAAGNWALNPPIRMNGTEVRMPA